MPTTPHKGNGNIIMLTGKSNNNYYNKLFTLVLIKTKGLALSYITSGLESMHVP